MHTTSQQFFPRSGDIKKINMLIQLRFATGDTIFALLGKITVVTDLPFVRRETVVYTHNGAGSDV